MKKNDQLLQGERQQRILEILKKNFTARSSILSKVLGVSEMTIRRDFESLERQGSLERIHGGAVFRHERVPGKFHYNASSQKFLQEKERIAKRAAELIEPNDVIYVGEGVTTAHIVRYVNHALPFTLITNNLGILAEFGTSNTRAELVFIGGSYNPITYALGGPTAVEAIGKVNARKVFLGADGISLKAGVTDANLGIAVTEREMFRQTYGRVIVMADHSKFGLVAEMVVMPIEKIDVLITDQELPADFKADLDTLEVELIIA